ncbi:yggJ [Wigglesworthia glossinidia endosymbiont of Glossina brevipalpis]|uniref:Ribosomal RNA small subunit methyltransferase E n=1 Tax=Wigglesworthia glossinidia brevipalpis TaxID=36870 RepID=Q8D334_WIGBR|nr:yggJ [Wigglesworthia glossinidia endosymbiont of Glossina brevipalpis]
MLVLIFNGKEKEFLGKILKYKNKNTYIFLMHQIHKYVESTLKINLGQVLCNKKSMDFLVQKSVELGIHTLTPLFSSRSNEFLNKKNLNKIIDRWEKIIIQSSQQCGRNFLLKINDPISIYKWCDTKSTSFKIYADPYSEKKIKEINQKIKNINLLIGPEGGLSKEEVFHVEKNNFNKIKFGPRILRTETSVISIVSILQMYFGDF